MRISRLLFLLGTVVFSWNISVLTVQADADIVMRTDLGGAGLEITDQSIREDGEFGLAVKALVKNTSQRKQTYFYGIEFHSLDHPQSEQSTIVRQAEPLVLEGNQDQYVTVLVSIPAFLDGRYAVFMGAENENSNMAAMRLVGEKSFVARDHVVVDQCQFSGQSVSEAGLTLSSDETANVTLSCDGKWTDRAGGPFDINARLIDGRYVVVSALGTVRATFSTQTSRVEMTLHEKLSPGTYQIEMVAIGDDGAILDVPKRVPLTITGTGGKIMGVSDFKQVEKDGSVVAPVTVSFEVYDHGDYILVSSVASDGLACAEDISMTVQNAPATAEGTFILKNECLHPVLTTTLLTADGKKLDQYVKMDGSLNQPFVQQSSTEEGLPMKSSWGLWVLLGVLGVFVGWGVVWMYRRTHLRGAALFFLLSVFSGFLGMGVNSAHAGTTFFALNYICNGSCPTNTTVWYTFDTNKNTYAPGENIQIQLLIGSDDYPQGFSPVVQVGINNANLSGDLVPGTYSAQAFRSGVSLTLAATAPVTAGPFNLTFAVGLNGYLVPSRQNIPLTVSGTTPTANLIVTPGGTQAQGTNITWTLSSSGAQSCEVVENPGNTIYVNKTSGVTSASVTNNSTGVGTWTYSTRCWSGPNGTGTVSSTDTDVLTISGSSASANFTSLPPCSIADGQAGCNTTIGWTSSGVATAVLTNCANVLLATRGVGAQSFFPVYVPYNSGCYRIHDGSAAGPILTQGSVSASCANLPWQPGTGTCGTVNAVCGTADGTVQSDVFALSQPQVCNPGELGHVDGYLSGDTISGDKKTFFTGSSNNFSLGVAWSCDGYGGGYSQWCRLYKPPMCGSSNNGSFASPPTDPNFGVKQSLCQVGIPTAVNTNASNYTWQCNNTGSAAVSCQATRTGSPSAQITANVVQYSTNDQSVWKKFVAFVTGRDHVALATGSDATISTTGTARINWSSSGVASCTIAGPGVSSSLTTGNQQVTGAGLGVGTHTYTISCFAGAGNPAPDSVKIIVVPAGGGAPTAPGGAGGFFTATPGACGTGTINVSWNTVAGATDYELERDGSAVNTGAVTSSAHGGLVASSNHSYRVRAHNASGYSSWSSTINQAAPNACGGLTYTINASAGVGGSISPSGTISNIAAGSTPTFTITPSGGYNISSVLVDGSNVGTGGSYTFPPINANHTIVASFAAASGPALNLTATPMSISSGGTTTLSWSTTGGVTSCWGSNSGNPVWDNWQAAPSGSRTFSPVVNTNYFLECWNGSGISTGQKRVTVTVGGGAVPIVTLAASPTTVGSGAQSTLSWSTTPSANDCFLRALDGSGYSEVFLGASGSKVVTVNATTSYDITCFTATGTAGNTSVVTITVTAVTVCGTYPIDQAYEGGPPSSLPAYGSQPYRYGYNILRAIMHRGLLSQGEIGLIRRDTAGMSGSYTGSVANGVTTGTYNGVPECGENFSRLPDPTGDFVLTGCDIAIGQSTCNATLNYWSAGMPTAMVRVFQGLVTGANLISNTASAVLLRTVQYGSGVGNTFSLTYPYSAADGTSKYFILKQQLLTVNCVPGGVWDVPSGKCVVSAGPSAALNICPTGTPSVVVTGTQNLTAWYTPTGTSFVGCSNNPAGAVNHTNRTSNAVWSTSGASTAKATVGNGVNGGVVTGVSATAGIPVIVTANDATNSVSNAININVLDACPPDTCNNHAAQAAGLCVGQSFTIDDLCGNPNTPCGGTRVCDYNWKEVAP